MEMSEKEVEKQLFEEFYDIVCESIADNIISCADKEYLERLKQPKVSLVHRWRYSIPANSTSPENVASQTRKSQAFLWNSSLMLGTCGDYFSGRIEGAFISGNSLGE